MLFIVNNLYHNIRSYAHTKSWSVQLIKDLSVAHFSNTVAGTPEDFYRKITVRKSKYLDNRSIL